MRPIHRILPVAMFALVIAACSAPSSSSTPSPSAGALTPGSSAPPASPIPSDGSQPSPSDGAEPGTPTGVGHSVECDQEETRCEIHQTDAAGREAAGWPVTLDGPCRDLVTRRDGLAYVGCSPAGGATIHVLDLDGQPVDGWPALVSGTIASVAWNDFSIGCGVGRSAIELGSDGSVYVAISTRTAASVHVFNPDGRPRAGWPQAIPGDAPGQDGWGGDGCRGIALSDDDGVVAWGYHDIEAAIELEARRTEFKSWSADGEIRPGWPRGSTGPASGPLLDSDGGITYVSASGKVWSHDDAGEIRTGWPYVLDHPAPPFAAPDGRVVIVQEVEQAVDRLVILNRDGRPTSGGYTELPADIETRCIMGDTPCAGIVFPTFADDGTMYVPLAFSTTEHVVPDTTNMGGAIVALDVDGDVVAGWPVDLAPRIHVRDLSVDVEDRLVARGFVCAVDECFGEGLVATTMIFAPDGELLEQRNGD
jgi:hypothetical protein